VLTLRSDKVRALVKKPRLIKYRGLEPGLRDGKGFSLGELKAVGIDIKAARKLGIPVDTKRRSVHEWNIERLKEYLSHSKK